MVRVVVPTRMIVRDTLLPVVGSNQTESGRTRAIEFLRLSIDLGRLQLS